MTIGDRLAGKAILTTEDSPKKAKPSDAMELIDQLVALESHANDALGKAKSIHTILFGASPEAIEQVEDSIGGGGLVVRLNVQLNSILETIIQSNGILTNIMERMSS